MVSDLNDAELQRGDPAQGRGLTDETPEETGRQIRACKFVPYGSCVHRNRAAPRRIERNNGECPR
jgi:hypothetical protein